MMKRFANSCIFAITMVLVAACLSRGAEQPFSVTITAPKGPVKAGSRLVLLVTIKNTWNRSITFATSPGVVPDDSFDYEIDVHDAQGRPAPASAYVRFRDKHLLRGSGSVLGRTLQPGESFTDQVTVTMFYDLTQPGQYTVFAARAFEPWQNLGKGSVKSNTITITIIK